MQGNDGADEHDITGGVTDPTGPPEMPYMSAPSDFSAFPPPPPSGFNGDILASEEPPARRRRLLPVLAAIAAVLLIAGGIVGVKAYQTLSGGGPQPDKWAPSTTFAFAKFDLNPPAGAKVALYQLSQKFPSMPRAKDGDDLRDQLFRMMFAEAEHVDYAQDIKPWIGDRFAVAGFTDRDGAPHVLGIIAHKNKSAAEKSIAHIAEEKGLNQFVVEDDFVLVSEDSATAQLAAELAQESSLASNGQYGSDIRRLHGNRVFTAWADMNVAKDLLTSAMEGAMGPLDESVLSSFDELYNGRMVMGVHVDSNYLELEARQIDSGLASKAKPADIGPMVTNLPSGTAVALALAHPDELLKQGFDNLESNPEVAADIADALDVVAGMTGLTLPDDLSTLMGSAAVLSVGNLTGLMPQVTLRTRPTDLDKAQDIAEQLADLASGASGGEADINVKRDGQDLVLSMGTTSDKKGGLGDDATFRRAVGDLNTSILAVGYVDLRKVWKILGPETPPDLKPLTAVGVYTAIDGQDVITRIRVVADR